VRSLLADTHILLWALDEPERLAEDLRRELENSDTQPIFSVISVWEIAIKANLARTNLRADAQEVRSTLKRDGWRELEFGGEHAIVAAGLPLLHGDPFDRALIAQARVENVELVTADKRLRAYGAPVRMT
jgi:PIN domain nuclease of toxin-antitoxin system